MDLDSAHFYIPDEQHYAAEVRFEKEGPAGVASSSSSSSPSSPPPRHPLPPDILQLVDNMIGILKGDSKVLN